MTTLVMPEEMLVLVELYATWMLDQTNDKLREKFIVNLTNFGYEGDPDADLTLTYFWLKYCEHFIKHPNSHGFFVDDIKHCIHNILEHNQILRLAQIGGVERTIAYLCQTQVDLARAPGGFAGRNVVELLSQWSGTSVKQTDVDTAEKVTNFLYGTAAWSLFRDAVNDDRKMAEHLWSMNLPVAIGKRAVVHETSQDLPNNIS